MLSEPRPYRPLLGTNVSNLVSRPFVVFANIQVGCRLVTGRWFGASPEQWRGVSLATLGNDALLYRIVGFPVAATLVALLSALLSYPAFRLFRARPLAVNGKAER